jgi:hypothetical protein
MRDDSSVPFIKRTRGLESWRNLLSHGQRVRANINQSLCQPSRSSAVMDDVTVQQRRATPCPRGHGSEAVFTEVTSLLTTKLFLL